MALPESVHLVFAILLGVLALALADHLWRAWAQARARRRRLMARIDQLRRERPTMRSRP